MINSNSKKSNQFIPLGDQEVHCKVNTQTEELICKINSQSIFSDQNVIFPLPILKQADEFAIKDNDGVYRVHKTRDLQYFKANGKHTELVLHNNKSILLKRKGIGMINSIIGNYPSFARVHKSYIINIEKVIYYDPCFKLVKLNLGSTEKIINIGGEYKEQFERKFFNRKISLGSNSELAKHGIIRVPSKVLLLITKIFLQAYKELIPDSLK